MRASAAAARVDQDVQAYIDQHIGALLVEVEADANRHRAAFMAALDAAEAAGNAFFATARGLELLVTSTQDPRVRQLRTPHDDVRELVRELVRLRSRVPNPTLGGIAPLDGDRAAA